MYCIISYSIIYSNIKIYIMYVSTLARFACGTYALFLVVSLTYCV